MIKRLVNRFKAKPTVFLILCTLIFMFGIPTMFYAMSWDGGASLYALLPVAAMFFSTIGLWIDYGLVNFTKIKLKWINLIEGGILVVSIVLVTISYS